MWLWNETKGKEAGWHRNFSYTVLQVFIAEFLKKTASLGVNSVVEWFHIDARCPKYHKFKDQTLKTFKAQNPLKPCDGFYLKVDFL